MIKIKSALNDAYQQLAPTSPSPQIDADLLLAYLLNKPRAYLYAHATDHLDEHTESAFVQLLAQRTAGMPIAYLIGSREFWSLPLCVTNDTLIPRPETELLVELTLSLLHDRESASILDLGTGSGAIAIALATAKPDWSLVAVDASPNALCVAQKNAYQLQKNNVIFHLSDWFASIPHQHFDAIVSNPPYLSENDPHLHQGDVRFEPPSALISGPDGLNDIKHIIDAARSYLKPEGVLLLEHGYQQQAPVTQLLSKFHYENIQSWPDHQGHPRVSGGFLTKPQQ
jgi:release factor glutamine methyltransferase